MYEAMRGSISGRQHGRTQGVGEAQAIEQCYELLERRM